MEDCCAVCAEPLEWVGIGPCGHREVCFTCISRMRFILNDKRCCLCKQDCPVVFVTKALGDYTRVVSDWKSLLDRHSNPADGNLLYDNFVEAYFDDEEQYKTIKAMWRLYCSICEKATEEESGVKGMMKKGHIFRNIDSLRRHQFMVHRVYMCELCMEGRKVFMCQQRLYSKSQLEQHASKGDSEVDGNEEERGGFAGHPMCAFCRKRFYGDNELYQHMSQDHYTCHICQRARPGHYEYYRNYDDLEAHFRQEHVLCEHSDCLSKKFVVFPSEAELKRHNATTHGGHMSRSQRNAALQIPVSFHYRRTGQDASDDGGSSYSSRRGNRGRGGHLYTPNGRSDELDAAVRASFESAQLEEAVRESSAISSSLDRSDTSNSQRAVERSRSTSADTEVVTSTQGDGEIEPSRYLAAVWGAGPSALGDAAFPPLPGTSKSARRRAKIKNQGPASMAALLGGSGLGGSARGGIRVLNAADVRSSPGQPRPSVSPGIERARPDLVLTSINRPEGITTPLITTNQLQTGNGIGRPPSPPVAPRPSPPVASRGATGGGSSSIGSGLLPKESGVAGGRLNVNKDLNSQIGQLSMEDIRAANKALVERIRAGLEGNEQQFGDFKDVSSTFKKGEMSSKDYYVHIARLGLSYVVPELARLCPDPRKAKELMDAHAAQLTYNIVDPKTLRPGLAGAFVNTSQPPNALERRTLIPTSKSVVSIASNSSSGGLNGSAPTSFSVRNTDDGPVEVLSTDGYRSAKGKSKITEVGSGSMDPGHQGTPSAEGTLLNELAAARDRAPQVLVRALPPLTQESSAMPLSKSSERENLEGSWACGVCTLLNSSGSFQCAACGTGKPGEELKGATDSSGANEKRKKKTPKFQRVRLGDGSASALSDSSPSNPWGQPTIVNETRNSSRSSGQGVWNNGGGQRLVSMVQREK